MTTPTLDNKNTDKQEWFEFEHIASRAPFCTSGHIMFGSIIVKHCSQWLQATVHSNQMYFCLFTVVLGCLRQAAALHSCKHPSPRELFFQCLVCAVHKSVGFWSSLFCRDSWSKDLSSPIMTAMVVLPAMVWCERSVFLCWQLILPQGTQGGRFQMWQGPMKAAIHSAKGGLEDLQHITMGHTNHHVTCLVQRVILIVL